MTKVQEHLTRLWIQSTAVYFLGDIPPTISLLFFLQLLCLTITTQSVTGTRWRDGLYLRRCLHDAKSRSGVDISGTRSQIKRRIIIAMMHVVAPWLAFSW